MFITLKDYQKELDMKFLWKKLMMNIMNVVMMMLAYIEQKFRKNYS